MYWRRSILSPQANHDVALPLTAAIGALKTEKGAAVTRCQLSAMGRVTRKESLMRLMALAGLVTLLGLAGCAEKWSKPGGTEEEFEAMKASCTAQAYSEFPPMLQQIQASNGYYTPITTNCYSTATGSSCYQQGGQYIPPVIITVDQNNVPRRQAIRACFYSNGWSPATGDTQTGGAPPTPSSSTCNPGFDCD